MTNEQKIESECRQKLLKLDSEYQQKLIPYTISGHESLSGLPDPIREWLPAESRAKVEAILTEVPPEMGGDCGRARSAAG